MMPAGKLGRNRGDPQAAYTLDASLLELDVVFAENAEGLGHFVSNRIPGAMDAERLLAEANEVGRMNPDIVMIENNIDNKARTRGTIHIVEVGYCWDPNWTAKQKEKEEAYEEVVENLKASGWIVEFTVLPVGAMGMSVDFL